MAWFLESGPPEPVMQELTFRSDSPYFCGTTTERTVSVDRHEQKHFWSPSEDTVSSSHIEICIKSASNLICLFIA